MIPELAALLKSSVEKCLEDRVSVAFSGGLDSTLIAHLAKVHAQVDLFTCGTNSSQDLRYARENAKIMKLALHECSVDEKEIIDIYGECYRIVPAPLLKEELLVPVYRICQDAAKNSQKVMLFGSGSEELFVGYERYYKYLEEGKDLDSILKEEFRTLNQREVGWVKKVCRKFDIEARFPFYDQELAKFVFDIPLEQRIADKELKKGVLREAAALLGAPAPAVRRKKQAMQYGSGIHKILLKHADELNKNYPLHDPSL
ncbi:hypothetical protein HY988_03370 [Candidatus Micrarchaeota archaeon]|nr:hypothetical protein [Candidatus Micrarchaeota archaeon]